MRQDQKYTLFSDFVHVCMQAPVAPKPPRAINVKLRPFFWNKLPWKPDYIWARVQPGSLTEEQLTALEALFAQTAPSPQASKAAGNRNGTLQSFRFLPGSYARPIHLHTSTMGPCYLLLGTTARGNSLTHVKLPSLPAQCVA